MIHFTERIPVQKRSLLFYFKREDLFGKKRYYVTTIDWHGKAHVFYLQESEDKWILDQANNHPPWATDLEEELSNLIKSRSHLW